MYGQLSDLMKAGVPLLRGLETISKTGAGAGLAAVLHKVAESVSGGKALAEALADQPQVFPNLHVAMVRAGEKAGFLEDVLSNLSQFIERVDEMRARSAGP